MPAAQAVPVVSNSAFLATLAREAPKGSALWACAFSGTPDLTASENWFGDVYNPATQAGTVDSWGSKNAYFSVAALRPDAEGEIRRRKVNFARLLALVADDVEVADLRGQVSYILQTSPGKCQVGIFIDRADQDASSVEVVISVMKAMSERKLIRVDASGNNAVRYVRLPVGSNMKPRDTGPWAHQMSNWSPECVMSLEDACGVFGINLDECKARQAPVNVNSGLQDERLRTYTASILRGEALHDSVNGFVASLVASGTKPGAVVNTARALMDASSAPRDERFMARYLDIPRAVSTAVEKFKPVEEEKTEKASLPVLSLPELQAAAANITWVVKGVVPAASIAVMFGGSGTFKSFIALDMALHVAYGLAWLGKKTKAGPVVFLAAEGGAGLWRRIQAWHQARGLKVGSVPFYVVPVSLDLMQSANRMAIEVDKLGVIPSLVVIDTMSQTFSGEENSANEVADYLRVIGAEFRDRWSCAVVVIHHSGHQATERPRGSSAIRSNCDAMFGVFREESEMIATVENIKQKDGELFPATQFKLTSEKLGKDEDGDSITSLCATHINSAAALLSAKRDEAAAGRGGREVVALSVAQTGMPEKAWRQAFYSQLPPDMEMHAKKVAFYRVRNSLISTGQIAIDRIQGTNEQVLIVRGEQ